MARILIIHYHLSPGGVTRIIESQVRAIAEMPGEQQTVVMTGQCSNPGYYKEYGAELIINEKLNYLDEKADYYSEYESLKNFFRNFIRIDDILHVHNLNLGKNPVLTQVISELVDMGQRVINHAHDFAEDRPENYKFLEKVLGKFSKKTITDLLYPANANFVHAVLNSTDLKRLLKYGPDSERIFLLPNPVVFSESSLNPDPSAIKEKVCAQLEVSHEKKLITYPVRVIRRKNIGEYILLCWLFREQASWVVTQPPKNPIEIEPYLEWKQFCEDENIPLVFEAGTKADFEDLLHASDFCFTSSIKEGFGMVYMEPWLLKTPVIGRNLTNITADLEKSGMIFPLLYRSLDIIREGSVSDFGYLSMQDQMHYIYDLKRNPEIEKELYEYNSFLKNLLNSISDTLVNQNKTTILQEYSLNKYGQRLERIYQKLTG